MFSLYKFSLIVSKQGFNVLVKAAKVVRKVSQTPKQEKSAIDDGSMKSEGRHYYNSNRLDIKSHGNRYLNQEKFF